MATTETLCSVGRALISAHDPYAELEEYHVLRGMQVANAGELSEPNDWIELNEYITQGFLFYLCTPTTTDVDSAVIERLAAKQRAIVANAKIDQHGGAISCTSLRDMKASNDWAGGGKYATLLQYWHPSVLAKFDRQVVEGDGPRMYKIIPDTVGAGAFMASCWPLNQADGIACVKKTAFQQYFRVSDQRTYYWQMPGGGAVQDDFKNYRGKANNWCQRCGIDARQDVSLWSSTGKPYQFMAVGQAEFAADCTLPGRNAITGSLQVPIEWISKSQFVFSGESVQRGPSL